EIDMLQAAVVHDGARRQAAAVHQLHAAVIDHGRRRRTVDALQAAAVDKRAGRAAAHLYMLHPAVADHGITRQPGHLLYAAKQRRFGGGAVGTDNLHAVFVHAGVVGVAAAADKLLTAAV